MALSILSSVGPVLYAGGRVIFCCLDFFAVTEDKEMPKNEKIFRVFCDALTIVTQAGSLGAKIAQAAQNARLLCNGAATGADFIQKVSLLTSKKGAISVGDYLDLGAGTLLQVSCLINEAIVFHPEYFGSQKDLIKSGADLVNIGSSFIVNRQLFFGAWGYVERIVKRLRGKPLVVVAPNQGTGKPFINIAPIYAEEMYRLKQMKTIDEINEIPSLYDCDEVFKQFRCALTGKPIRHLVVVAGTEEREQPILFEHQAISQKIKAGKQPTAWPEGITFTEENLRKVPISQNQINKELTNILDDIHRSDLRFEPLENFADPENQKYLQIITILKAIGLQKIHEMQDSEICDAVVAKVSPNTIADVTVTSIWHQFHELEQPKPAKAIRFTPTVTLIGKNPLSDDDLFKATRAALISRDIIDRRALVLAQLPFELCVSTDLQNAKIESAFAKCPYERDRELIHLMKEVLEIEELQGLSDKDLAQLIIKSIAKDPFFNVFVRSVSHPFINLPEAIPAKAFIFSPPAKGLRMEQYSIDTLFAAARALFGSLQALDKQALNKRFSFIIYIDPAFQNIEIKELL